MAQVDRAVRPDANLRSPHAHLPVKGPNDSGNHEAGARHCG
jgi:hypothetical protein